MILISSVIAATEIDENLVSPGITCTHAIATNSWCGDGAGIGSR
jgi:hypothetical protein